MSRRMPWLVSVLLAIFGSSLFSLWPQSSETILAQVERLASLGSKGDQELSESIAWQIDANREATSKLLLPKLQEPSATESQLATYAWALGWTHDTQATPSLISLYQRSTSEWIQYNCLRSLAMVGDRTGGSFLLSVFDGLTDEDERYSILDMLAQMKYEPALSRAEGILHLDYREYYWKPIFIFGKMGDQAVPFLLSKIDNEDTNVRTHAVHLLGRWLMALEAADPLRRRFWYEQDAEVRGLILGAIENTDPDFKSWEVFFGRVQRESKIPSAVKFAGETLDSINRIKEDVTEFIKRKAISKVDFDREYSKLFRSSGHEGDYEALAAASTLEDEPALKKLRERILGRNSDESFYDYAKINKIIAFNRFAARMTKD